jgi:hypothetical protein
MHARECAVPALVRNRDQPLLGGDSFRFALEVLIAELRRWLDEDHAIV